MSNYSNGVRYEYYVKRVFEKNGWFVIRSSGSHGMADLVSIKGNKVIIIQIKSTINKSYKVKFTNNKKFNFPFIYIVFFKKYKKNLVVPCNYNNRIIRYNSRLNSLESFINNTQLYYNYLKKLHECY